MELLQLVEKFKNVFSIEKIEDVVDELKSTLLNAENCRKLCEDWILICPDLTIDYMQMIFQYYFADRKEKMQDYENELAKLRKQFSVSKLKDYWWSGHYSFTDMCEYVIEHTDGNYKTMVINLYFAYKRACCSLHASNFGNTNRLGNCLATIDLSPLDEGQEYALDLAIKSFIMVVAVMYRELGMDYKKSNKKLNQLATFYQSITQKE